MDTTFIHDSDDDLGPDVSDDDSDYDPAESRTQSSPWPHPEPLVIFVGHGPRAEKTLKRVLLDSAITKGSRAVRRCREIDGITNVTRWGVLLCGVHQTFGCHLCASFFNLRCSGDPDAPERLESRVKQEVRELATPANLPAAQLSAHLGV
ncbi:hypothetical protein B0H17DRAFT_1152102 [Mycena rosella]|uniref:Uncharacterized protein n=1 Tax=Mycena rosella TaxID=1033263 RepID=A0AAD7BFX4_MYCRO|nr:hypothetical protein B0H17DRAFT_1152102 [Mycena rosella]